MEDKSFVSIFHSLNLLIREFIKESKQISNFLALWQRKMIKAIMFVEKDKAKIFLSIFIFHIC